MTDTELDALRQQAHAIARSLDLEWARRQVDGVTINCLRQHPDGNTPGDCWYVIYYRDLERAGIPDAWSQMESPALVIDGVYYSVYESHAAALDDLARAWLKVYGGDL